MSGAAGTRRFDHVAIAVRDCEKALPLWVDALGARFVLGGDNDETGNRVLQFAIGGFKLEMLQPLRPDNLLDRTIARRGEGFHHVTFVMDDLEQTLRTFDAAQFGLVGTDLSNPIWRETFVRPSEAGGALVQLVDTDRSWSEPVDGITLDDVLAGRVGFRDAWPCWRNTSSIGSSPRKDHA